MDYDQKRYIQITQNLLPEPSSTKKGKGLINTMINKLPFEAHLPGYNYAGPGTHLELNLEKGIKPINGLDKAAMFHDIAYSKTNDLNLRHQADTKLENDAWGRFLASDSDMSEKFYSWLVTNSMKVKKMLEGKTGGGVKRASQRFVKYPVMLDLDEQQMIANAKQPFVLKLDYTQFLRTKTSVMNGTYLPLTPYQVRKVKSQLRGKKSVEIKLSLRQLEYIRTNNKTGGFLPGLLAALPAIAGVGTLISSAVNTYNNKKANDLLVQEKVRHNQALEAKAKSGINTITGNGLFDELMKTKAKKKKSLH